MVRILVAIFSLVGSYSYGREFIAIVAKIFTHWHLYRNFLIAFAASFTFFFLFVGPGNFFPIFEHEFTHMVWGLLFFKKPRLFAVAESEGGVVGYTGYSNFLISLAPYFSLTINFLLIGVYYLLKPSYYNLFFIIYGIALGYHTSSTIKEFSLGQPDIGNTGVLFSIIFLIFANIVSYGIALSFVVGRGKAVIDFLKGGFIVTIGFFREVIPSIKK